MAKKSTQKIYIKQSCKLTVSSKFIYEVSLYEVWKDRAQCVDSQYYASEKPLKYKEVTVKSYDDHKLIKYVTWLSAPLSYLLNNNFKLLNNE